MKLPRLDFLRRSIGAKIIFWFLAINIVSCGLLAWRTYDISRESLEQAIQRSLQVVAKKKVEQLETLTLEKIRSVESLMHSASIGEATREFSEAIRTSGRELGVLSPSCRETRPGSQAFFGHVQLCQLRDCLARRLHAFRAIGPCPFQPKFARRTAQGNGAFGHDQSGAHIVAGRNFGVSDLPRAERACRLYCRACSGKRRRDWRRRLPAR